MKTGFDNMMREAQKARKELRDKTMKEAVALYFEGLSYQEVAWELGISESSAMALIEKGTH